MPTPVCCCDYQFEFASSVGDTLYFCSNRAGNPTGASPFANIRKMKSDLSGEVWSTNHGTFMERIAIDRDNYLVGIAGGIHRDFLQLDPSDGAKLIDRITNGSGLCCNDDNETWVGSYEVSKWVTSTMLEITTGSWSVGYTNLNRFKLDADKSGNVYFGASKSGSATTADNVYALDGTGTEIWKAQFGDDSTAYNHRAFGVAVGETYLHVVGTKASNTYQYSRFLLSDGTEDSGDQIDFGAVKRGVAIDAQQNVYIVGDASTVGGNTNTLDVYDSSLTHQWGNADLAQGFSVSVDAVGNVYAGGNDGLADGWIYKYNSSGTQLASFDHGTSGTGVTSIISIETKPGRFGAFRAAS